VAFPLRVRLALGDMPFMTPKGGWPVAAVLVLLLLLPTGRFAGAQEPTSVFARAGTFPKHSTDAAAAVHRGQLFVIGGDQQPSPTGLELSYQSDDDGRQWSEMQAATPKMPPQVANMMALYGARMISFQLAFHTVPSLVVTGGHDQHLTYQPVSDTMFLLDGNAAAWTVLSPSTSYPGRNYHGFVSARSSSSHAERLYVFGGLRVFPYTLGNDVWFADDAVSKWHQVTASAPWAPRYNFAFATVADRSRVIIAGGCCDTAGYHLGDAWISNVGLSTWTPLPPPPFSAREGFSMVNVQHNLYVLGGWSHQGSLNDVWVSSDEGRSWLLVTSDAGFSPRAQHAVAVRGRKVVVVGGQYVSNSERVLLNDVWAATLPG